MKVTRFAGHVAGAVIFHTHVNCGVSVVYCDQTEKHVSPNYSPKNQQFSFWGREGNGVDEGILCPPDEKEEGKNGQSALAGGWRTGRARSSNTKKIPRNISEILEEEETFRAHNGRIL